MELSEAAQAEALAIARVNIRLALQQLDAPAPVARDIDPVRFVEDEIGADLWDTPRAIMRALDRPGAMVAIKGCHRSSKTWGLGNFVIPFVEGGGRVLTTAPSGDQVELVWREIRTAYGKARARGTTLRGEMLTHEWKEGRETLALGRSTDKSERFQGGNFGKLLIIGDEAPGIRGAIMDAIEGIRSGGDVRVALLGNPTLLGGQFYEAFHSEREHWQTFTIDAYETPNLSGVTEQSIRGMTDEQLAAKIVRPYMITGTWVKEKLLTWGPLDPRYQSRVRGQFPTQSTWNVYPLTWLENARERAADAKGKPLAVTGKLFAGIDPAGDGSDEFAACIRRGCAIVKQKAWSDSSGWDGIQALLKEMGGPSAFEAVIVDADGIGYGVAKQLKDLGYKVVFSHAQQAAEDRERFDRFKDEAHWTFRERFEAGQVTGLTDETTIAQLSQIQWRFGPMKRIQIESKEDMRARGAKSPDRAEAAILAFATIKPKHDVRVWVS